MRTDDLLVLLEIARCGSLLGAGDVLGLNHTTVSRRIAALERSIGAPVISRSVQGCDLTDLGRQLLGACEKIEEAVLEVRGRTAVAAPDSTMTGLVRIATTEAFGAYFITPVMARLHRSNPGLQVEIVTQTRLTPYNSGADIEIGVGEPVVGRPGAQPLSDYALGLYAASDYVAERGRPTTKHELREHSLVYYIEGLLRVEDLDVLDDLTVSRSAAFASTSVQAQLFATAAGAGIGLLPMFVADREPDLIRIMWPEIRIVPRFSSWLASGRLRRPAALLALEAIQRAVRDRQCELLPAP